MFIKYIYTFQKTSLTFDHYASICDRKKKVEIAGKIEVLRAREKEEKKFFRIGHPHLHNNYILYYFTSQEN